MNMSHSTWVYFLMRRRPPRSTRADALVPDTTLFRSDLAPLVCDRAGAEALRLAVDRSDTSVEIRDTFGAVALEAEEMQAYASRQSAVKSVDDRDNSIVAAHCTSAHRAHSDAPLIADHPLQRVEAAQIEIGRAHV